MSIIIIINNLIKDYSASVQCQSVFCTYTVCLGQRPAFLNVVFDGRVDTTVCGNVAVTSYSSNANPSCFKQSNNSY